MTDRPPYAVHQVDEDDVTVDWFFGPGHLATTLTQLVLVVVGWFFAILPVVITVSALTHREGGGWWSYEEGYELFDTTMTILGVILLVFVVGFLALHVVYRLVARRRNRRTTYDVERLERRLSLADDLYASKYGAEELRLQERNILVEPYADLETYELRDRYRTYGVD